MGETHQKSDLHSLRSVHALSKLSTDGTLNLEKSSSFFIAPCYDVRLCHYIVEPARGREWRVEGEGKMSIYLKRLGFCWMTDECGFRPRFWTVN